MISMEHVDRVANLLFFQINDLHVKPEPDQYADMQNTIADIADVDSAEYGYRRNQEHPFHPYWFRRYVLSG